MALAQSPGRGARYFRSGKDTITGDGVARPLAFPVDTDIPLWEKRLMACRFLEGQTWTEIARYGLILNHELTCEEQKGQPSIPPTTLA